MSGYFVGNAITRWITDRQNNELMVLMEDFAYVRNDGTIYTARQGMIFDGASIPQWCWSLIGSPYTGPHRQAAIIHDQLCKDGVSGAPICDSKTTHMIFREGIRDAGGSWFRAWAMWLAVYTLGPKF